MLKKATKIKDTSTKVPSAWICSTKDNGRKSVKNGKVFLKNNETFQIELYNPTDDIVLANIIINGISISKNGVYLEPNNRVYVDYVIDSEEKNIFMYKHSINDTSDILNGEIHNISQTIQIFFYQEIGTILELVKNLKKSREKTKKEIADEELRDQLMKKPLGNLFNGNGVITTNPFNNPYNNLYNGNGLITTTITNLCGTITHNSANNITLNSTSNNLHTSQIVGINSTYTADISDLTKGEIAFVKSEDNIENDNKVDISNNDKELEYQDDYINTVMFELLPDTTKPTTMKEINEHKKSRDNISKLIDLKNLLENGYITRDEFDKLKSEII